MFQQIQDYNKFISDTRRFSINYEDLKLLFHEQIQVISLNTVTSTTCSVGNATRYAIILYQ